MQLHLNKNNTRMIRMWLLLLTIFCTGLAAAAQDLDQYQKHWFIQNGDTLPYRILLPENFDPGKKYPLVFFLHGRGESGRDNEKQLALGGRLFLADSIRKNYPAIVVFPQCNAKSYWSNVQMVSEVTQQSKRNFYFIPGGEPSGSMQLAIGLLEHLMVRYPIKKDQVYTMGLSMGGMGVFEMVRRKPGVFAAAIPICGGAHPATAAQLTGTKWWLFHGGKDDVVLPEFSASMHTALKKAGARVKFTLYPMANHNSWDSTFAEPGLLKWLFAQR